MSLVVENGMVTAARMKGKGLETIGRVFFGHPVESLNTKVELSSYVVHWRIIHFHLQNGSVTVLAVFAAP